MRTIENVLHQQRVDSATLEKLLQERREGQADFVLIDIREPYEYEAEHIVGVDRLLPTSRFQEWAEALPQAYPERPVILTCRTSNRTGQVCRILKEQLGMRNVIDHIGGIVSYDGAVAQGMEDLPHD